MMTPTMTDPSTIKAVQHLVIRRPVSEVFAAFADPEVTTRFWFNRSTGPLAKGATVRWFWDIYDVYADVEVLEFEPEKRILFEWGDFEAGDRSTVEMTFETRPDDRTYVHVVNSGFPGDLDQVIATALDSVGGFSLVLAAAKAWLEFGVDLHVVADKF